MGYWPHPPTKSNTPPVLKFFNHPSPQTFYSPPARNGRFCIFHTWLLPASTCSYFWSYNNWLNAVTIDFYRSWNNTLKKHVLTIMLFYFFMCDDLCLINTMQKTLKSSKKMFQCSEWMRKNFIFRNFSGSVAAETWAVSCFKKCLLKKQQSVQNTCIILPLKKIF